MCPKTQIWTGPHCVLGKDLFQEIVFGKCFDSRPLDWKSNYWKFAFISVFPNYILEMNDDCSKHFQFNLFHLILKFYNRPDYIFISILQLEISHMLLSISDSFSVFILTTYLPQGPDFGVKKMRTFCLDKVRHVAKNRVLVLIHSTKQTLLTTFL